MLSEADCFVLLVEDFFFFKLRLQLSSFPILLSEGYQVLEPSSISHSHPCLGAHGGELSLSTTIPGPCGRLSSTGILLFALGGRGRC